MTTAQSGDVRWPALLGGFAVLYAVLQGAALSLNSTLGEYGLIVGVVTVAAALVAQRLLFARSWRESWHALGLGRPAKRGMSVGLGLGALMIAAAAVYLGATGFDGFRANAAWLALGLFAQAGVAEEVVFRGFLYGRIRRLHSFWTAASLSMLPFAAAHLTLFATMDWPIALASLLLSVAISFPFAKLYDLGGGTIWAPAIVHAIIQGAPKLVLGAEPVFPVIWIGMVMAIACLAFFVRPSSDNQS